MLLLYPDDEPEVLAAIGDGEGARFLRLEFKESYKQGRAQTKETLTVGTQVNYQEMEREMRAGLDDVKHDNSPAPARVMTNSRDSKNPSSQIRDSDLRATILTCKAKHVVSRLTFDVQHSIRFSPE